MVDRRSRALPNRIYRRFTRRGWRVGSVVFIVVGLLCFALSNSDLRAGGGPATESVPTDFRPLIEFLAAGIVVFGLFAGLSHWVAKPAAREIVAEHGKDPDAHGHLASVAELKNQFTEVTRLQDRVIRKLIVMDERVKHGFEGLACKEGGPAACVKLNDDDESGGPLG